MYNFEVVYILSSVDITPQRVNRGGNLAPAEVVGRDRFIARLWETLERQSVLLTAERRMGKTSIVKKMRAQAPTGVAAVYRSFEAVRTRQEFVEALLTDLRDHLPISFRARTKLTGLLKELKTVEIGRVRLETEPTDGWKGLLDRVFAALDGQSDERTVFFWDEVPIMLGGIAEAEGPAAAQELLNTLRFVRQTYECVRMVFTGSVGLHHVVTVVRPEGYATAPTNDMLTVTLGGLDDEYGSHLVRNLFAGERLTAALETVPQTITRCTSGIPFYIQGVVGVLRDRRDRDDGPVEPSEVEDVVSDALHDPVDQWEFRQYRERIDTYYRDRADVALAILDVLAVEQTPTDFGRLTNLVNSRMEASEDAIRSVVELLQLDHYLLHEHGRYRFAFDIVARSWAVQRDLVGR